jgi:hypothetical protein
VDFNRLLNEGKIAAEAHADFLTQPQDGVVAFEMENKWRQYYAGRPEILQYGQPEIQCGARMCEIRLLATGSMEPSKWYSTIMHGRSMSAYPIPPGQSVAFDVLEDRGVTAIIGLAVHNKPKQQVQK